MQSLELIEYPCVFTVKVVGRAGDDFVDVVLETVRPHAPDLLAEHISLRPSRNGRFIGATVRLRAESREQLDAVYRALTAHRRFDYVL